METSLSSYAEYETRMGERDASNSATQDVLLENNEDLVMISKNDTGCDVCMPWDGVVISLDGETPGFPTLSDAEDAGVFHPNCYHILLPVDISDLGEITTVVSYDTQEEIYWQKKAEREAERAIRYWERREAVALTPDKRLFAAMRQQKWEDALKSIQENPVYGSIGKASEHAEAVFHTMQLGLTDEKNAADLADLSTKQLNDINRNVVEIQSTWNFDARLDEVHGVDRTALREEWQSPFGIDTFNAAAGNDMREGKQGGLVLVVGPDAEQIFALSYLNYAELFTLSTGLHTTTEELLLTRAAIISGARDYYGIHSVYTYANPMDGIIAHEMGHVLHAANQKLVDQVALRGGAKAAMQESQEGEFRAVVDIETVPERFQITDRAKASWEETVAENYSLYRNGFKDDIDPELRHTFDTLTKEGEK